MPILGSAGFEFKSDDKKILTSLKNLKTGLKTGAVAAGAMTAKWALFGKGILKNTDLLGKLNKVWIAVKATQVAWGKRLTANLPLLTKSTVAGRGFRASLAQVGKTLGQVSTGLPIFSRGLGKVTLGAEAGAVGLTALSAGLGSVGGGAAAAGAALTGLGATLSIVFIEAILLVTKSVGTLIQSIGVGLVGAAVDAAKNFAVLERATFGVTAALDAYTKSTGKASISTQQIVEDSIELQRTTGLMSTEIQQAFVVMLEMSRVTGLTSEQIRILIERAADFATVAGVDFQQVIIGIDQALRGFPQILQGMGLDLSKVASGFGGLGTSMSRTTTRAQKAGKALAGVNAFLEQTEFAANKAAEAMGSTLFGSMQAVESRADLLRQELSKASSDALGPMIILSNKLKLSLIDLVTPFASVIGSFRGIGGVMLVVVGTFIAISAQVLVLVGAWKLLTSVMTAVKVGSISLGARIIQMTQGVTRLRIDTTSLATVFRTLLLPLFKSGVSIISSFVIGLAQIIPIWIRWIGLIGVAAAAALLLFNSLRKTNDEIAISATESRRAADELDGLIRAYEELSGKTNRTTEENDRLKVAFDAITKAVPGSVIAVRSLNKELRLNIEIAKERLELDRQIQIGRELEALDQLERARRDRDNLLGQSQQLRSSNARFRREQQQELQSIISDKSVENANKREKAQLRFLEINARIAVQANMANKLDAQIFEKEKEILKLRRASGEIFPTKELEDKLTIEEKIANLEAKAGLARAVSIRRVAEEERGLFVLRRGFAEDLLAGARVDPAGIREQELKALRKIFSIEFAAGNQQTEFQKQQFELEEQLLLKKLSLKDKEQAKTKTALTALDRLSKDQSQGEIGLAQEKANALFSIEARIDRVKLKTRKFAIAEQEAVLRESVESSAAILARGGLDFGAQAVAIVSESNKAIRELNRQDTLSFKAKETEKIRILKEAGRQLSEVLDASAIEAKESLAAQVAAILKKSEQQFIDEGKFAEVQINRLLARRELAQSLLDSSKSLLEDAKSESDDLISNSRERIAEIEEIFKRESLLESSIKQVGGEPGDLGTVTKKRTRQEVDALREEKQNLLTEIDSIQVNIISKDARRSEADFKLKQVDRDILKIRKDESLRQDRLQRLRISTELARIEGDLRAEENTERRRSELLKERRVELEKLITSLEKARETAKTSPLGAASEEELQAFNRQIVQASINLQETTDEIDRLDDVIVKTGKVLAARLQDQSRIIGSFITDNFNLVLRGVDQTLAAIILKTGDVKEVILAFNREILAASIQFLRELAVAQGLGALTRAGIIGGGGGGGGGGASLAAPVDSGFDQFQGIRLASVRGIDSGVAANARAVRGLAASQRILGQTAQAKPMTEVTIVNISDPSSVPRFLANNPRVVPNIVSDDIRANGVMRRVVINPNT